MTEPARGDDQGAAGDAARGDGDQEAPPSATRPPDVEIDVGMRAKEMRFRARPNVTVRFAGRSLGESHAEGGRENVSEPVDPGETYRNARAGWRATAWLADTAAEAAEETEAKRRQEGD